MRLVKGLPLALLVLFVWPTTAGADGAAYVNLRAESHGAHNAVTIVIRVSTNPKSRCRPVLRAGRFRRRLPWLRTSDSGGGRWQGEVVRGVRAQRWRATAICRVRGKRRRDSTSFMVPRGLAKGDPTHLLVPRSVKMEKSRGFGRGEGGQGNGDDHAGWPIGECTWFVATKRPDLPYFARRLGDAHRWLEAARREGIPTGDRPVAGAVAVFKHGQHQAGPYGHVAYVEAVEGDWMTISESNFAGHHKLGERRIRWSGLKFIYGGVAGNGPVEVAPPPAEVPPAGTSPVEDPVLPAPGRERRNVRHYECADVATRRGRTLLPGQYWGHPFAARGDTIRGGRLFLAAPDDGTAHHAVIGIYRDKERHQPFEEVDVTIPVGGNGTAFTFGRDVPVQSGDEVWFSVTAVDELVLYEQFDGAAACVLGHISGAASSALPTDPGRSVVVDNRVTEGAGMLDDAQAVQLTSQPKAFCGDACAIADTIRWSRGTYSDVYCQAEGDRITNGNDHDTADDHNPELVESHWYYGVRRVGGGIGYVSEVWIRAEDRGGLGLPIC